MKTFHAALGAPLLAALLGLGNAWAAPLSQPDQQMLTDLAMANMAEIETAKLALQKTQSDRVKSFAQQMVDEHTKGLDEVRKVAKARNLNLPTELDSKHKALASQLEKLSGDKFDRSYMEQAGVQSHREADKLVSQAASTAQDSELKALATRLQPTIHQHLNNAEQLNAAINTTTSMGASGTHGKSGSSKTGHKGSHKSSSKDSTSDSK